MRLSHVPHSLGTLVLLSTAAVAPLSLGAQADVSTWHNDTFRTGANTTEAILTPARVNSSGFGALFSVPVDGKVDAQPLYISAVSVPGKGSVNIGIAATEHDSVYAFNADSGAILWKVSLLAAGETPSDARGCNQVTPEIGITATPVVDRNAGHGTIYVVAMSKDSNGNYIHRLHALDLTTGAESSSGAVTIAASYPGTGDNSSNGRVVFDPKQYKDRPALLLNNGTVYTSWSSHCDIRPYTGWIIGYNSTTLKQSSVFNFVPNGSDASPWNAGAGPAADLSGNVYISLGNGTFDSTLTAGGFPSSGDYGNSLVKMTSALTPVDYWTMYNTLTESNGDVDLGSGGLMLLPDFADSTGKVRHLAVAAGKDSNLYVADRDNLGKFNPNSNSTLYQEIPSILSNGVWSSPAYFNNRVYYGSINSVLRAFDVSAARLSNQPTSISAGNFPYPGTTPSVSAYGNTNGIVWAIANSSPAVLHAYDATNLAKELYNSTQAGTRDGFGAGNKFIAPTIAGGKVFLGTPNSVAVFGLLHTSAPVPDGVYALTNNASHLLLDDANRSTASGNRIIQWPSNGGTNQKWFFSSQGNGYYLIQNVLSGLFLSDPNGSTARNTGVVQQSPTNNDAQIWSLVRNGSGYTVVNKASGLVLDDPASNTQPNTGIILWSNNGGSSNQSWNITQAQ